ncbi:hypothetical protein E4U21_000840 [Claviceps maximensis]|nr:hypothetical protein E4U21_000840 [Claviceps maximensis]
MQAPRVTTGAFDCVVAFAVINLEGDVEASKHAQPPSLPLFGNPSSRFMGIRADQIYHFYSIMLSASQNIPDPFTDGQISHFQVARQERVIPYQG